MKEVKKDIFVNSIENANDFINKSDKRITPNERINDLHFVDIANKGAKILGNQFSALIKKDK